MNSSRNNFKFVLYPKAIISKGIYYSAKLPEYCISIINGTPVLIQTHSKKMKLLLFRFVSRNCTKLTFCFRRVSWSLTKRTRTEGVGTKER